MDQSSSGGRRGPSNNNRNRGGQNDNRRRNNRGGEQKRTSTMKKNGENRGRSRKPAPQKKDSLGTKVLRFFGLGKKDEGRKPSNDRSGKRPPYKKRERKPMEIAEPTSGRLYVGNLDFGVTDSELAEFFGKAGKVVSADVISNPHNGRSKGFGFVEMSSIEEAKNAVNTLQKNEFKGRELVVSGAKGKPAGDREPRRQEGERPPRRDGASSDSRKSGGDRSSRNDRQPKGRKRYEDDPPADRKPRKVETVSGNVLKVENLIAEVTEEDLREVFRDIVEISSVKIEPDEKGTARVEFASVEDAQKAVNILHGKSFMGETLSLTGKL